VVGVLRKVTITEAVFLRKDLINSCDKTYSLQASDNKIHWWWPRSDWYSACWFTVNITGKQICFCNFLWGKWI